MAKPLFRDDPTTCWEGTVGPAWMRLCDEVRAPWEEWSAASPENARARRLAERICGVSPEYVDQVVYRAPRERLPTAGDLRGYVWLGADLTVLWACYLDDARDELAALDSLPAASRSMVVESPVNLSAATYCSLLDIVNGREAELLALVRPLIEQRRR